MSFQLHDLFEYDGKEISCIHVILHNFSNKNEQIRKWWKINKFEYLVSSPKFVLFEDFDSSAHCRAYIIILNSSNLTKVISQVFKWTWLP